MAKILTFRNKGDAPSGQDFLTDENQTLSFRMTEDGAFSLGGLTRSGLGDIFPDPKKDWGNQELADLFRVRQLLSSANVPVETDRGVTDEGDPWFVFCHANGEVFIHLCRIDGLYVLDSPNVLRPLRGSDFNELISDFTNQAIPKGSSEDDPERRVIRLERGGKVRLHPSAMLAALIWTLFLASEELVLLAPEDGETDSGTLLDFDGMFAVETTSETAVDLFFDEDTLGWAQMIKDGSFNADHHALQDSPTQMRDTQHQQQGLTAHNNAFSLGLSTIAIAMGFMSETVLLDNQRKVLEGLKELGFSEYGSDAQQVAELEIPADTESNAILKMLAEFLGLDLSRNTELADAGTTRQSAAELAEDLAHLTSDLGLDNMSSAAKVTTPVVIRDKSDESGTEHMEALAKPFVESAGPIDTDAVEDRLKADVSADATNSIELSVQNWSTITEFQFGQLTFKTEFELSNDDAFALFDLIDTSSPNEPINYREFDTVALRLIEFLEAKDGEIGFIELHNEIIMIDRTALTQGQTDYIQWEAADGRTISFIGLATDFEQFDMIA